MNIVGQSFEVRYIGVDSGDLPTDANAGLVAGKQVMLVTDTSEIDDYGRLPHYVIADGLFVNLELIKQGAAYVSPHPSERRLRSGTAKRSTLN